MILSLLLFALSARPDTIVVTPGSSVAAAIARAHDRDVIRVEPGTYAEPMIVVDKQVTLVGDGWPVLDGKAAHQIMSVTADDVTVRGFVFRNVGTSFVEDRAALKVTKARGCTIAGNRIERTFFGIYLAAVNDCWITNNVISGAGTTEAAAGNGIHLWTSNRIHIEGNHISGQRDGIYFEFVRESEVRGNTSEHNLRYGLHFMYSDDCRYVDNVFRSNSAGVAVMMTKRVTMEDNRFESNWGSASYGLLLKEVYDVRLERNHFVRNTVGLLADGANRIHAEHNEFRRNGWALKLLASTDEGHFRANNFIGNTFDVATNNRESTNELTGNYWDAYRGYDLDHDGVGDVPFHPVRLFSLLVQTNEPSLVLLRSVFVSLLDAAERAIPTLTPQALVDRSPMIHPIP
jgi:nitrous oxidase accessory protein